MQCINILSRMDMIDRNVLLKYRTTNAICCASCGLFYLRHNRKGFLLNNYCNPSCARAYQYNWFSRLHAQKDKYELNQARIREATCEEVQELRKCYISFRTHDAAMPVLSRQRVVSSAQLEPHKKPRQAF